MLSCFVPKMLWNHSFEFSGKSYNTPTLQFISYILKMYSYNHLKNNYIEQLLPTNTIDTLI